MNITLDDYELTQKIKDYRSKYKTTPIHNFTSDKASITQCANWEWHLFRDLDCVSEDGEIIADRPYLRIYDKKGGEYVYNGTMHELIAKKNEIEGGNLGQCAIKRFPHTYFAINDINDRINSGDERKEYAKTETIKQLEIMEPDFIVPDFGENY